MATELEIKRFAPCGFGKATSMSQQKSSLKKMKKQLNSGRRISSHHSNAINASYDWHNQVARVWQKLFPGS